MEKAEARRTIKEKIAAIPPDERSAKSLSIGQRIIELPEYADATVVLLFASLDDEVNTLPIIQHALKTGKTVLLPKVLPEQREMVACPVTSLDCLSESTYGILEPEAIDYAGRSSIDFCLVPARAFDNTGARLGRGAGYYDKFMADPGFRAVRCGIAYSEQLLPTVPCKPHDLPVQIIVTDAGIIRP